jgi:hypothetical protein
MPYAIAKVFFDLFVCVNLAPFRSFAMGARRQHKIKQLLG